MKVNNVSLWQRIWAWLASDDPNDKPVDSAFLNTTGAGFPLSDMHVPGEATHKFLVRQQRERNDPDYWDRTTAEAKKKQEGEG